MAENAPLQTGKSGNLPGASKYNNGESRVVRALFIFTALLFLFFVLILPLVTIFAKAFEQGLSLYIASITEADALAAIRLTLFVVAIVVPLNLLFGVAAAWANCKI